MPPRTKIPLSGPDAAKRAADRIKVYLNKDKSTEGKKKVEKWVKGMELMDTLLKDPGFPYDKCIAWINWMEGEFTAMLKGIPLDLALQYFRLVLQHLHLSVIKPNMDAFQKHIPEAGESMGEDGTEEGRLIRAGRVVSVMVETHWTTTLRPQLGELLFYMSAHKTMATARDTMRDEAVLGPKRLGAMIYQARFTAGLRYLIRVLCAIVPESAAVGEKNAPAPRTVFLRRALLQQGWNHDIIKDVFQLLAKTNSSISEDRLMTIINLFATEVTRVRPYGYQLFSLCVDGDEQLSSEKSRRYLLEGRIGLYIDQLEWFAEYLDDKAAPIAITFRHTRMSGLKSLPDLDPGVQAFAFQTLSREGDGEPISVTIKIRPREGDVDLLTRAALVLKPDQFKLAPSSPHVPHNDADSGISYDYFPGRKHCLTCVDFTLSGIVVDQSKAMQDAEAVAQAMLLANDIHDEPELTEISDTLPESLINPESQTSATSPGPETTAGVSKTKGSSTAPQIPSGVPQVKNPAPTITGTRRTGNGAPSTSDNENTPGAEAVEEENLNDIPEYTDPQPASQQLPGHPQSALSRSTRTFGKTPKSQTSSANAFKEPDGLASDAESEGQASKILQRGDSNRTQPSRTSKREAKQINPTFKPPAPKAITRSTLANSISLGRAATPLLPSVGSPEPSKRDRNFAEPMASHRLATTESDGGKRSRLAAASDNARRTRAHAVTVEQAEISQAQTALPWDGASQRNCSAPSGSGASRTDKSHKKVVKPQIASSPFTDSQLAGRIGGSAGPEQDREDEVDEDENHLKATEGRMNEPNLPGVSKSPPSLAVKGGEEEKIATSPAASVGSSPQAQEMASSSLLAGTKTRGDVPKIKGDKQKTRKGKGNEVGPEETQEPASKPPSRKVVREATNNSLATKTPAAKNKDTRMLGDQEDREDGSELSDADQEIVHRVTQQVGNRIKPCATQTAVSSPSHSNTPIIDRMEVELNSAFKTSSTENKKRKPVGDESVQVEEVPQIVAKDVVKKLVAIDKSQKALSADDSVRPNKRNKTSHKPIEVEERVIHDVIPDKKARTSTSGSKKPKGKHAESRPPGRLTRRSGSSKAKEVSGTVVGVQQPRHVETMMEVDKVLNEWHEFVRARCEERIEAPNKFATMVKRQLGGKALKLVDDLHKDSMNIHTVLRDKNGSCEEKFKEVRVGVDRVLNDNKKQTTKIKDFVKSQRRAMDMGLPELLFV
ncbi:hypothetical protein IAR55_005263 [Kwoniella newhampshirensis]|uniref:Uncharacterized protein n=1 Tax=Kwoniella newhampshirensis TaxID=1651941 RepID=A0AAW0YVZ8_9TREE